MGTAKRERQKANRQQRLEELARSARQQKRRRIGLRYGVGIPALVLVVAGLFWWANRGKSSTSAASTTTIVSTTVAPSTTVDPNAPTTTLAPPPSTVPGATITGDTPCPKADGSSPRTITFAKAPPTCIDATKTYTATVVTNKGELTVALDAKAAPLTVNNFVVLARYHYFDSTVCHRIIPGFMAQCGDLTGTGKGSPGYAFADELPTAAYAKGDVAMANGGANTNGSQFFVVTGDGANNLPLNYSKFGKVTGGIDTTVKALDAAGNPDTVANGVPPLEQVVIESVTIAES